MSLRARNLKRLMCVLLIGLMTFSAFAVYAQETAPETPTEAEGASVETSGEEATDGAGSGATVLILMLGLGGVLLVGLAAGVGSQRTRPQ